MKLVEMLDMRVSQADFAQAIGVSEAKVSQLVADGIITRGDTVHEWIMSYCERLREVAAGRASGEVGGLDLVQERAALARSQRIAQDLKNSVASGEFAPIGLLADVLAMAATSVVDRFDQLEGALRKACPDLPDEARLTVMTVMASARNEWIRSTEKLVVASLDQALADMDAEDGDAGDEGESEG